jgi:hypothetical protein
MNKKQRIAELEAENGRLRLTIQSQKQTISLHEKTISDVRKAVGGVYNVGIGGGGGAGGITYVYPG